MHTVRIISWNTQGKPNVTGYTRFSKVRSFLEGEDFDVIVLQELRHAHKKLQKSTLLERYTPCIPPSNSSRKPKLAKANNNIFLSKLPFNHINEASFTHHQSFEHFLAMDIRVGTTNLRVYNCHFPIIGVGIRTRISLLKSILAHAQRHPGPVIVTGDFNVTIPKKGWRRLLVQAIHKEPRSEMIVDGEYFTGEERELFLEVLRKFGFSEALNTHTPTWSPLKTEGFEPLGLKLDWFITRGVNVTDITLGPYISDHRPIIAHIRV